MDKNTIKKYAVWARRELIERVSQRALVYGITAKNTGDPNTESVNGHLLSQAEKRQRQALIRNIKEKGYEQVMEEVAYTWFNRFAALRFMEVNGYLPSHIRVFTNDAGEFKPQILAEAIHLELDGLDMNKVYELESANKSEELFKYLLIVQCNALNSILPGMFQRIEDYTELLLPDNLLREGSVIEQMVTTIPEEDWTDQVQIIGWLYQYYNTEPKDKVFAELKKNIKITKENIPAATQLFTPDWIVHYMVENSLGRLWLEGHPNDTLKSEWKYHLDEAEQEPEVQAQLATIRKEYAALKPEEIRVIDPCMGSGHILCVLFDVLVRIYEDYGYTAREAVVKIVENNLWGLDIDERAAQLSYFAVMMKARQYDRRFFTRKVQPHVHAIEESNGITSAPMHDMGLNLSQEEYSEAVKQAMRLVEEMHDAKEYGSIIHVTPCDWDLLRRFAVPREEEDQLRLDIHGEVEASARIQELINVAETLSQKYHIVVTNPPYMGNGGMSAKLSGYISEYYNDGKADLFATFILRCLDLLTDNGMTGMMTSYTWMFLSGYQNIRQNVVFNHNLDSLIQPEYHSFFDEAYVPICTFVIANQHTGKRGTFIRLERFTGALQQGPKALEAIKDSKCDYRYSFDTDLLHLIPGSPLVYWANSSMFDQYTSCPLIQKIAPPKPGLSTGENDRFLRFWHEADYSRISFDGLSDKKWYPINKGGEFRKWYGNHQYIVNWENDGFEIKNFKDKRGKLKSRPQNLQYNFMPAISWSLITTGAFSVRYYPDYFMQNAAGICCYPDSDKRYYLLGFLNSKPAQVYASMLSPTLNTNAGDIARIPFVFEASRKERIDELVTKCIAITTEDWDAFEVSWNFYEHPFISATRWSPRGGAAPTIKRAFEVWAQVSKARFHKLKENEEELNRIFIDIYGLDGELAPEVKDKDVTVRRADLQREVRSFISYAVGCMFGRYSLDVEGLVYAGGDFDTKYCRWIRQFGDQASEEIDENGRLVHGGWAGSSLWEYDGVRKDGKWVASSYPPDTDNIIPICDDEYFEDDIVGRFVKFVETVYGTDTLDENLKFIADALGGSGQPKDVIRNYFLNGFYADHLKVYQKRPIYWLFDSGKKNGFKCLVYMHRYQPDTIARIRTDYVHEQQSRYRTAIADLEQRINGASTSERVKLSKQLAKLQAQAEEIRVYEEKIHHLADQMIKIDLDDGVKHNYEIFKDVLAKIK